MKRQGWLQAASDYLTLRSAVLPLADTQQALDSWFHSRNGQYLLARERQALEQVMPTPGAHRMLYLGAGSCRLLRGNFDHLHSFCLSASPYGTSGAGAVSDFDALPLPSETVDTVLLHHALEFSQYPHDVLSEVARVLTPSGHAVIVIFNPVSLFGLAKWPARYCSRQFFWRHHSLRYRRLLDWLRLLNLQAETAVSGCFTWPLASGESDRGPGFVERTGQRLGLPCGAFYVVRARKYIARLTPLRPRLWQPLAAPLVPGVKKTSWPKHSHQNRAKE